MIEDLHVSGTFIASNSYYNMVLKSVTRNDGKLNVVCFTGIKQKKVVELVKTAIINVILVHRNVGLIISISMEVCNDLPHEVIKEQFYS